VEVVEGILVEEVGSVEEEDGVDALLGDYRRSGGDLGSVASAPCVRLRRLSA